MNYLRHVIRWIDSLESGLQFRRWSAIFVRGLGVVLSAGITIWSVRTFIGVVRASEEAGESAQTAVIFGSALEVLVVGITATLLAMLFWNRANKISVLADDPDFILVSIAMILVQLVGELGFLVLMGTGVQTLVASIFGSGFPEFLYRLLPELKAETLLTGIVLFLLGFLAAPVCLIVTYFIAEEIGVYANIAATLKQIEAKLPSEKAGTSDS